MEPMVLWRKTHRLLCEAGERALCRCGGQGAAEETAARVTAPVLYGFCRWVLGTAQKRGWKRLYFLARDGWVLRQICEELCRQEGWDTDCRYLYVSRLALRKACFHLTRDWEQLFQPSLHTTLRGILSRMGLDAGRFGEWGLEKEELDKPLLREELFEMQKRLSQNDAFSKAVLSVSEEAFKPAMGYFEQEGLLDGEKIVLVDTGWTGSMQRTLRILLESGGWKGEISGLYFGLYVPPVSVADGEYQSWYFAPESSAGRKASLCNNVVEAMCAAPHGMTLGYEEKNGRWEPVLAQSRGSRQAIFRRRDIVLAFCREMQGLCCPEEELLACARRMMGKLCKNPSVSQALAFAGVLFCDDVGEGYLSPLAVPVSRRVLREYTVFRRLKKGKKPKPLFWPEGCLALSPVKWQGWYRLNLYGWELLRQLYQKRQGK